MGERRERCYKLMACPRCQGETSISCPRPLSSGAVHRIHQCKRPGCGFRFSTRETVVGLADDSQNAICAKTLLELLESCGIAIDWSTLRFPQ